MACKWNPAYSLFLYCSKKYCYIFKGLGQQKYATETYVAHNVWNVYYLVIYQKSIHALENGTELSYYFCLLPFPFMMSAIYFQQEVSLTSL